MLTLLFPILFAVACYVLGTAKGYSGALCALAGFFGGLISLIVILLLPDREEEQAASARRDSWRNEELSALKRRISELEAAQKAAEPAKEPALAEDAEAPCSTTPVRFPARTTDIISCPNCGKRQRGNRDACYSCGTPFQYEAQ